MSPDFPLFKKEWSVCRRRLGFQKKEPTKIANNCEGWGCSYTILNSWEERELGRLREKGGDGGPDSGDVRQKKSCVVCLNHVAAEVRGERLKSNTGRKGQAKGGGDLKKCRGGNALRGRRGEGGHGMRGGGPFVSKEGRWGGGGCTEGGHWKRKSMGNGNELFKNQRC